MDLENRSEVTNKIFDAVETERQRQLKKWGPQRHPDVHPDSDDGWTACSLAGIMSEATAKNICETDVADGNVNWAAILAEEFSEAVTAFGDGDLENAKKELIEVMAVAKAWLEDINTR